MDGALVVCVVLIRMDDTPFPQAELGPRRCAAIFVAFAFSYLLSVLVGNRTGAFFLFIFFGGSLFFLILCWVDIPIPPSFCPPSFFCHMLFDTIHDLINHLFPLSPENGNVLMYFIYGMVQ